MKRFLYFALLIVMFLYPASADAVHREFAPTYGISLYPAGDYDFGSPARPDWLMRSLHFVTITNTGNQPTGELTVTLDGAGAKVFLVDTNPMPSIAVGESRRVSLVAVNLDLFMSGLVSPGSYNATVTISGANIASQSFRVIVSTNGVQVVPPVITTSSLPTGTEGETYSATLNVSGTPLITWSLGSGSLPNDLNLSNSGMISGTPTTAGTFNITVRAENSAGSDTRTLSIVVDASPSGSDSGGCNVGHGSILLLLTGFALIGNQQRKTKL